MAARMSKYAGRSDVLVLALRQKGPARVVVAVPVASREACEEFRGEVDDVVCAATPEPFMGVGRWYEDFSQTTDEEVRSLLARPHGGMSAAG